MSKIAVLLIVIGCFGSSVSAGHAVTIRPECKNMRDKLGCTCALNNGGRIKPDGRWTMNTNVGWGTNRGRHLNEASYNCIRNQR